MSAPTQERRPFRLETPLGADTLLLVRFTGEERVSTLFRFVAQCWSQRDDIDASKLLLQPVTIRMQMDNGRDRKVSGIVKRMSRGSGAPMGWFAYELEIVPKHWMLTCDAEFDIWQEKTAKEICDVLFSGVEVQWKVQGTMHPRPYTFRYRESSWNCASRLLEQYGVWYYFDYNASGAKLVLADNTSAAEVHWDTNKMAFGGGPRDEKLLSLRGDFTPYVAASEVRSYSEFMVNSNIREQSPAVGTNKLPASLDAHYFDSDMSSFHSAITHGGGERNGDGSRFSPTAKRQALLRQQLAESSSALMVGTGSYAGLQAGAKVDIAHHDVPALNGSYFVVAVRHEADNGGMFAGDTAEARYENSFECIPVSTPFRPPRVTPWPVVSGSHIGTVVGPSGEEIFTDKYGRVQVAFRWDGENPSLERSCWIRVAQPFAGSQFGAVFLPRIGHEVLVEFLEGNPDNPIVVGSLYNNVNLPPWKLPDHMTQSGVRTRSSKGGGADNYNELRFEDKKGSEEVYLQAEMNLTTLVKNDETRKVLHDRTTTIQNKDTKTVKEGNDETVVEKGNQSNEVTKGNRSIKVGNDQTVDVAANYDLTIGGHETIAVTGNRKIDVTGNNTVTITGKEDTKITGDQKLTIDGKQEVKVTGQIAIESSANIQIKAPAGIKLVCGANSVEITPAGVTIKGTMVKVEGSAMTEVKAPMTQVKGDGMLVLKGGVTMIN